MSAADYAQESADLGKAAFTALMTGGRSGFNAVLGGGRNDKDKQYARIDAHGFYWTSSESGPDRAWFYNFGSGAQSFGRHEDGEKLRAFSVRCVRDSKREGMTLMCRTATIRRRSRPTADPDEFHPVNPRRADGSKHNDTTDTTEELSFRG